MTHKVDDGSLMGKTCFIPVGDDQQVIDWLDNAWNVRVKVETDYGKVRYCAPWTVEVDGQWATCDYDHREDSCWRFRLYEQLGADNTRTRNWSPWSQWVSVSTGDNCLILPYQPPLWSEFGRVEGAATGAQPNGELVCLTYEAGPRGRPRHTPPSGM